MNPPTAQRALGTSIRPLKALWQFTAPYKGWIAFTLLFLLSAAFVTLYIPIAVRNMIDLGFLAKSAEHINHFFIILLVVSALLAISSSGRFYCVSWLGERIMADLRQAVYSNVLMLSPTFFESTKVGEVISRLTTDTTLVERVIGTSASVALRNAILFIGALIMLIVTSWHLSLLVIGLIPCILVPIIVFGRLYRRLSRVSQDTLANSNALANETLSAITISQAFNHQSYDRQAYDKAVDAAFVCSVQRIRARSWLTLIVIFLIFSAIVCVLWVGATFVIAQPPQLTPGKLGQFVIYAILVASSAGSLTEVWGEVQRAAGATERLIELLQATDEQSTTPVTASLQTHKNLSISFDHVTQIYPSRPGHKALDDFSLTIKPGETIALVGPSGAGKSTVFQLIMRFYEPQSGSILINDLDIRSLSMTDLRELISLVPQDTVIFSTDAMENIRYGQPTADDDAVIQAALSAQADTFIRELPQQYNTYLGERGVRMSGGQRQRIAIARAILRNTPILLLDEATSSLDAHSEQLIQIALHHLMQDRTTIIIAHRLATVLKADRIVVLDHGRIDSIGDHATLMKKSALYRELATLQFHTARETEGT